MALTHDKVFQMRASEDFFRQIDGWRRQQTDIPSRAEAIRRLIGIGLGADPLLRDLIDRLDSAPYEDADTQCVVSKIKKLLG